jgi:hypothetical protein
MSPGLAQQRQVAVELAGVEFVEPVDLADFDSFFQHPPLVSLPLDPV